MSGYKVGDKVRIILCGSGDRVHGIAIGDVYSVCQDSAEGHVVSVDKDGEAWHMFYDEVQLVVEEPILEEKIVQQYSVHLTISQGENLFGFKSAAISKVDLFEAITRMTGE